MVAMAQISLWFKTRHDWGWAGIWLIHGFQQREKFCEELHAGWKEFSKLGMVPHTCNRSELRQKDCYEYGTSPVRSCPKKQNKKKSKPRRLRGERWGRGRVGEKHDCCNASSTQGVFQPVQLRWQKVPTEQGPYPPSDCRQIEELSWAR